jgi:hypothetical protein
MTTRRQLLAGGNKRHAGCEQKTCSRCQGRGYGKWVVAHCGTPGLCYKCDGLGQVFYVTTDEARDNYLRDCEECLAGFATQAAELKAEMVAQWQRREDRRARQGREPIAWEDSHHFKMLERELVHLRDHWKMFNREVKQCKAGSWPRLDRQAK